MLVVASDDARFVVSEAFARSWLECGACCVCAAGPAARLVEDAFDYASFLPVLGPEIPHTVLTTAHDDEPLEDALWFAFHAMQPTSDVPGSLDRVVILVDSPSLHARCLTWLLTAGTPEP